MNDDLSAILTAERNEAARNPYRSSSTRARAEELFDDTDLGPSCPAAARAGRWHMPHSGPCVEDPWAVALEVAS